MTDRSPSIPTDDEDWATIRELLKAGCSLPDRLQRKHDAHMRTVHSTIRPSPSIPDPRDPDHSRGGRHGSCVIIETTEGDDLISTHLSSTEARWLGAMILAAADAADRDAATKRGRFAGAVAGIEQDMRSAVEAVSRLPPGSGA